MTFHSWIALSLAIVQLLVTTALLAIPHMTPRDLLFGVPVPPGFRSSEAGRGALTTFRVCVAIPSAASLLGIILFLGPIVLTVGILLTPAVAMTAFVALNRKLKPFGIQPTQTRQTSLAAAEPLPWFVWLGIVPLLILGAVAVYMHAHWDQIPLRYPVHFDINGTPNRWADRSVRGVYGFLIFGGELALALFGMMLAGWYGSRRSDSMRRPVLIGMLATEAVVALLFAFIPLQTAAGFHVPIGVMLIGPLVLLLAALTYAYRASNQPRDAIDPTPNECWKGGVIYYNPDDAALFVQRRDGMGFTVNFGNHWSWVLFGGLLTVIATGPFVMQSLPK